MTHEKETLENITKARSEAMQANSVGDVAKAETKLNMVLSTTA